MARTVDLDALKTDLDEHGCVQRYDHEIEIALEATVLFVSDDGMVLESDGTDMTETVLTIARHVAPAPTDALRAAAQAMSDAYEAHVSAVDRHDKDDEFHSAMAMSDANDALRAALDGVPAPVALTEEDLESLAAAALDRMEMSVEAHEWVDPEQLLDIEGDGSDVEDWNGDYVKWDVAQSGYRIYGVRARDAVLANLREMRPELDWLVAK